MHKCTMIVTVLALLICSLACPAMGGVLRTLEFDPATQNVDVGSTADVEITISGLGPGGPPSVGGYALGIGYDPTLLGLLGVVFGDPVLGNQLALGGLSFQSVDTSTPGGIGITEISFDSPAVLDAGQAPSFTLLTLSFQGLSPGTSPLSIDSYTFSNSDGTAEVPIDSVGSGEIIVAGAVVPLPAAAWMGATLLAGMGGFGTIGRKLRR